MSLNRNRITITQTETLNRGTEFITYVDSMEIEFEAHGVLVKQAEPAMATFRNHLAALSRQRHEPFSQGDYGIAPTLAPANANPLPDSAIAASQRITEELRDLNRKAGR